LLVIWYRYVFYVFTCRKEKCGFILNNCNVDTDPRLFSWTFIFRIEIMMGIIILRGVVNMIKLTEEITKYLDYCRYQKKLNDKTIKAYSIDLTQFRRQISAANCTEKSEISKYITFLHKTFSPKTAKRKLASVKAFYSYMEYDEIITDNPIKRLKTKFQEPQVLPRTIPVNTIEKILAITYGKLLQAKSVYASHIAHRNIAIVELLFATGMRVSELCSLNLGDVNLDDGNIRIMGKGAKERMLQVGNEEVLSALRTYIGIRHSVTQDTDALFLNKLRLRLSEQSVRFMIRSCCTEAAVTLHITPHMFRHSFATLLLEEDVDIRYIQRMLGHSSIQTTQIYTRVTAEKQRKILTSKHPRNKFSFCAEGSGEVKVNFA